MNLTTLSKHAIPLYGDPDWRGKCPLESAEAVSFFCQLRAEFPELAKVATHIRNEGERTKWQANRQKQEGMNTGASDIIIPCVPPIVMEMKQRDHTNSEISKDQVKYLVYSERLGAFTGVALGAAGAMEMVRAWVAKHG